MQLGYNTAIRNDGPVLHLKLEESINNQSIIYKTRMSLVSGKYSQGMIGHVCKVRTIPSWSQESVSWLNFHKRLRNLIKNQSLLRSATKTAFLPMSCQGEATGPRDPPASSQQWQLGWGETEPFPNFVSYFYQFLWTCHLYIRVTYLKKKEK